MVKPNSVFEADARAAAERIEAARDAGRQLTFLPDEPGADGAGRPARGKGKATSQMRDWLASRGLRMPEDVLAEMAALTSREDVFLTAMAHTERVLAWAESGGRDVVQVIKDGVLIEKELDNRATTGQRLATFQFVFTAALRAAEALLPYGLAKVTPDEGAAPPVPVQVVINGAQGAAVQAPMRDVTPLADGAQGRRIAPPPMPHEIEQHQRVGSAAPDDADGAARTEGPSA